MKIYCIIFAVFAAFFCGCSAFAESIFPNDNLYKVKVKEAECLLYSEKLGDSDRGQALLYYIANRYFKVRFLLGLWMVKMSGDDNPRIKTGVSLINSAYYEGDRDAAYFMAYMYEKMERNMV